MKKILILFTAIFLVCGCAAKKETEIIPEYKEIMENSKYIIVDVRTESEYKNGHVKGAINIPYDVIENLVVNEDELTDDMAEGTYLLEGDTDTVVFLYCQSGGRSSMAYSTLMGMGVNAYNLGAYESIDLPKE